MVVILNTIYSSKSLVPTLMFIHLVQKVLHAGKFFNIEQCRVISLSQVLRRIPYLPEIESLSQPCFLVRIPDARTVSWSSSESKTLWISSIHYRSGCIERVLPCNLKTVFRSLPFEPYHALDSWFPTCNSDRKDRPESSSTNLICTTCETSACKGEVSLSNTLYRSSRDPPSPDISNTPCSTYQRKTNLYKPLVLF